MISNCCSFFLTGKTQEQYCTPGNFNLRWLWSTCELHKKYRILWHLSS